MSPKNAIYTKSSSYRNRIKIGGCLSTAAVILNYADFTYMLI